MPMFKTLNEQAKSRLDRLRDQSLSLYSKVLETGNERLDDLLRLSGLLGPGVRGLLEDRVERLQARLDEWNQSLAEHAVPVDRKHRVGRMALDSKARHAGQAGLRVVSGQTADRSKDEPGKPDGKPARKSVKKAGAGTGSADRVTPKNKASAKSKGSDARAKGKRRAGGKSPAGGAATGKRKTGTTAKGNGKAGQSASGTRARKSPAPKA